ncbi:MAG: cytochrome c maturation protein CcmE [Anaerolineae bacterium]|nr:cytochrome c maturation protein CcmE [Anaerolineae bacterium]
MKFIVGGVVMLAAVLYLVFSGMTSGAQYFITVDEMLSGSATYAGQTVRISGAVLGDTIQYQSDKLILDFTIVHIPKETGDLARTLHEATLDPAANRIAIHMENIVKPDLLEHEAQAILTGKLGEDGVFYATELLLKCPSRYGEEAPEQSFSQSQSQPQPAAPAQGG